MEQKIYRRYKNILEKYLDSSNGKRLFNIVYSVGAAIVILGAMFKLLHLPFGNLMLMVGMITEAIVFLLSAFERPDKEYKWEEVYPVLADDENFVPKSERQNRAAISKTEQQAQINNAKTNHIKNGSDYSGNNVVYNDNNTKFGSSSSVNNSIHSSGAKNTSNQNYTNTNSNILDTTRKYPNNPTAIDGGTIVVDSANVAEASEKYADQLNKMAENMDKFAKVTNSLGTISDSLLQSFQTIIDNSDGIGTNTKGYVSQMENLNRNIAGLNTIYEIQLKGVSGQINTIEEINAGLDRMKKLYSGSLADSSLFKNETEKMAKQLSDLNAVYARLLQAMTANINNNGFNSNNNNVQP